MKIDVTIKSFENEMAQFDFLINSVATAMQQLTDQLIKMDEPAINVEDLNTIHFTDNYYEELFAFQESIGQHTFATRNKIADGHAQVVTVKEGQGQPDDIGYHIFIDKQIPMMIMLGQWTEDNPGVANEDFIRQLQDSKNRYIRMIRHELAHVEDENNQKRWKWLEKSFSQTGLQVLLRSDAHRLWEEFFACKRSNFIKNADIASQEIKSLLCDLETAEKEICSLRWKYTNKKITLTDFVQKFHEYIRTAFIYCCYFMGHMDYIYEHLVDNLHIDLYPSRFYSFMPDMWKALHKMAEQYPDWQGPEVYDDLVEIILSSINGFKVYPRDKADGIYYEIPIGQLITKSEETSALLP